MPNNAFQAFPPSYASPSAPQISYNAQPVYQTPTAPLMFVGPTAPTMPGSFAAMPVAPPLGLMYPQAPSAPMLPPSEFPQQVSPATEIVLGISLQCFATAHH
jgi:hypothetical protein